MKPRLFKRSDGWCCIVRGDPRSRMGCGATPAEAYRSWTVYNMPWLQPILDQAHQRALSDFNAKWFRV